MPAPELPSLTVISAPLWRHWLASNGTTSRGVWLTIAKKPTSKSTTLTYQEALDEALCHGWIDSRGRRLDDATHTYRFTPRAAKGMWSKRNIGFVERLMSEGKMQPGGLACVEAAKADGRWEAAYSGPASMEMPGWFLAAVEEVPAARETWERLNKGNRYAVYMRLVGLRTERGRERATRGFVEMLGRGEGLVPQKGLRVIGEGEREAEGVNVELSKASKTNASKPKRAKRKASEEDDDEEAPMPKPQSSTTPARKTRSGRQAPSYAGQG